MTKLTALGAPRRDRGGVITDRWALHRPTGKYRGVSPTGLFKRLSGLIDLNDKTILHQFGGIAQKDKNNITIDINSKLKPSCIANACCLPFKANVFDVVFVDPPYEKIYAQKLYRCKPVRPYSFIKEAVRVCKPGGFICILHFLVYIRPKGTERYAVITLSLGPNKRVRALNIFQKGDNNNAKRFLEM